MMVPTEPSRADPPSDSGALIEAARAGDPEALGRLFAACRPYLLLVARSELDPELRAKAGASDLVQESFLEAQRDFQTFRGRSTAELLAWLRRILAHNVADCRRRYRETAQRQLSQEHFLDGPEAAEFREKLVADTPAPPERVLAREQADALAAALRRLPPDFQEVLRLRHQEGLAFADVGQAMARSAEAARKLWFRAVERLRQEMEPPHDPG